MALSMPEGEACGPSRVPFSHTAAGRCKQDTEERLNGLGQIWDSDRSAWSNTGLIVPLNLRRCVITYVCNTSRSERTLTSRWSKRIFDIVKRCPQQWTSFLLILDPSDIFQAQSLTTIGTVCGIAYKSSPNCGHIYE